MERNEAAEQELEAIRAKMERGELRDPDASEGLPLGWEGVEVVE
jgi:hypothetical protein